MTDNVISLAKQRAPVEVIVRISFYWNGELGLAIEGIGNPPDAEDRASLVRALKETLAIVEQS